MGIQVFEHENFGGVRETFTEGFFNLGDNDGYLFENIQNDSVSSFILDAYSRVTFFWHSNGQGQQVQWENNGESPLRVSNVGSHWNDQYSSMIVAAMPRPIPPSFGDGTPPAALDVVPGLAGGRFFEDWRYNEESARPAYGILGPRAQVFHEGEYNLPHEPDLIWRGRIFGRRLGVRPHSISSLQVGEGYLVELFDGPNLTGERLSLDQSTRDIREVGGDGWNDRAQSLRIVRCPVPR